MSPVCQAHLQCLEKTHCESPLSDAQRTSEGAAVMDGLAGSEPAAPSARDGGNQSAVFFPPLVFSELFAAFAAMSPVQWHHGVASWAAAHRPVTTLE